MGDSPKLLLILIVVSFSMAAPQINQRQVVGDVISQLEPAILEAVASLNLGGFSSSSSPSVASVTSSVASSLQPSIAAAVARALAGRRSSLSNIGRGSGSYGAPAENIGPARYDFTYKVSDDEFQTYIAQRKQRGRASYW